MSSEFYKLFHIVGFLMALSGLVGLWGIYSCGTAPSKNRRVGLALIHGVGMALLVVTGFGRASQLGIASHLPLWIYLKIVIWLALGASMTLAKRKANWGVGLVLGWIALGGLAAFIALYKPI